MVDLSDFITTKGYDGYDGYDRYDYDLVGGFEYNLHLHIIYVFMFRTIVFGTMIYVSGGLKPPKNWAMMSS